MQHIVELVKKHRPTYDGMLLTLDDVEFLHKQPIDKLLYHVMDNDELDFKPVSGPIGHGIYFSDSMVVPLTSKHQTYFTIVACTILGDIKINPYTLSDKGNEYCVFDRQDILPYCILYMSVRDY